MCVSATYLCPARGIINLEPPEPLRLGQSAQVARSVGIERLLLPVLEESLLQSTHGKVHYLDGLIRALDHGMEPKECVPLLRELLSCEPKEKIEDFIDISLDEYLVEPDMHLPRLWDHFQESCR